MRHWLAAHPRFHLHFTPTSSSWINMVESWFSGLTRKRLKRGVFRSLRELVNALEKYIKANNRDPKPFVWTKTPTQILSHRIVKD